jgi:hypothetical protein
VRAKCGKVIAKPRGLIRGETGKSIFVSKYGVINNIVIE